MAIYQDVSQQAVYRKGADGSLPVGHTLDIMIPVQVIKRVLHEAHDTFGAPLHSFDIISPQQAWYMARQNHALMPVGRRLDNKAVSRPVWPQHQHQRAARSSKKCCRVHKIVRHTFITGGRNSWRAQISPVRPPHQHLRAARSSPAPGTPGLS